MYIMYMFIPQKPEHHIFWKFCLKSTAATAQPIQLNQQLNQFGGVANCWSDQWQMGKAWRFKFENEWSEMKSDINIEWNYHCIFLKYF